MDLILNYPIDTFVIHLYLTEAHSHGAYFQILCAYAKF